MAGILRQVLERDEAKLVSAAPGLTRSEQSLLRLIDGVRTLARIVAMSPLPPADTLDVVARLAREGLVRLRGANGVSFAALEDEIALDGEPEDGISIDGPRTGPRRTLRKR